RGCGINGVVDGVVYKNTLAAYCHLHALAVPEWAPAVVARAQAYRCARKEERASSVLGQG
ncbi:MAG: hypothetical protein AB1507_06510, partial [Bacillota bacterium]